MTAPLTNDTERLFADAQSAAKRVAFQWPNTATEDDLTQAICMRFLEWPAMMERYKEAPEGTRRNFLVKVGHQIAREQQIEYDRYSGNYLYNTAQVQMYLEHELWLREFDYFSAEKADMVEAMGNLSKRESSYYGEIVNRYVYEIKPYDGAAKRRLQRAVQSLTTEMNFIGYRRANNWTEGPGSRSAAAETAIGRETVNA